jgi:hypothetical protein
MFPRRSALDNKSPELTHERRLGCGFLGLFSFQPPQHSFFLTSSRFSSILSRVLEMMRLDTVNNCGMRRKGIGSHEYKVLYQ